MLFHMIPFFFLSMVAKKPVNWDILIGCWGISTNQKVDIWATMESKTEDTMQKSIDNWVENWCQKIVYILLGVIILKNKQWITFSPLTQMEARLCLSGPEEH